MTPTWQVVIVGGGPAGLSMALHLSEHAPRVRTLVLERARYPRDKTCAGAIGGRARPLLERFGVALGRDVPAVAISRFLVTLDGREVAVEEPGGAYVVRRSELDHALARAALCRGIPVREGARVTGLERDARGVRVRLADGEAVEGDVCVGADGVTGVVRRSVGLARPRAVAQAIEVDTERVAGDPPPDTIRFGFVPALRGYTWDFPTPVGGRVLMSRGVYLLRDERRPGDDVRGALAEHLSRRGLRLEDHATRQLAEHGLELGARAAPLSAPRVLLVGEAAGIDFPTGEGIAQALAYGAVAGPYLAEALRDGDVAFADWRARLLASDEGRFLRRRGHGGALLYGAHRPRLERALSRSPRVLAAALGRFAGRRVSRLEAARALAQLGANLL